MTKVCFRFDTEDYTSDASWDTTVRIARLLEKYGIRGNFNIVGYLAREWVRQGRMDVLEALKNHDIGFHSLRHSYHPTICEYTDVEDYNEARARFLALEGQGLGMVKAVTGRRDVKTMNFPGMTVSYVGYYESAELGIRFCGGSLYRPADGEPGKNFHFCNLLLSQLCFNLESMFYYGGCWDFRGYHVDTFPDRIVSSEYVTLVCHPNCVVFADHWDKINYNGVNKHPMYEWEPVPMHPKEKTEHFFEELEKLIVKLKNDDRFEICSLDELVDETLRQDDARVITREELPAMLRQLKEKFWFVTLPAGTFCLTDCFAAAAHFLHFDEPYKPAFVRGFLHTPAGVTEPVTLSASEIKAAVKEYKPDTFLPNVFEVGGKKIGPADLLFAMLEVACGAERVTLTPRPQMPELSGAYARINTFTLKNSWIHSPLLEDRYLSKRLRLQTWTIRE